MVGDPNIGLQFALNVELNAFLAACRKTGCRLEFARNHVVVELNNSKVLALASGVGFQSALRAAEFLSDQGVSCVISSGIAGALDRRLRSGDIIVAKRVLCEASHGYTLINCDPLVAVGLVADESGHCIRSGDIVSSKRIICKPEEKSRMYTATGAVAVDMESYAVGQLCKNKGLKFAVVRAVADTCDQDLTGIFKDAGTLPGLFELMKQLACHPASVPRFIRLYSQTAVAVRHLGEFLVCDLFRKCPEGRCHQ